MRRLIERSIYSRYRDMAARRRVQVLGENDAEGRRGAKTHMSASQTDPPKGHLIEFEHHLLDGLRDVAEL